jgi:NAD-dependent dihydropyrimidine dehydrogenase PreA subunit
MERVLLKFAESQIQEPITAQIILKLKVPINILNADITPHGGAILIEVPSRDIKRVITAFQEKGVLVTVQKQLGVDEEKCIDCGACYSLCPADAITFKEDASIAFNEEKCISCGLCVNACPTRAITI